MIYSEQPTDWRDLQDKVASILEVSGCNSEVERIIKTVRGNVEVDVYAIDLTTSPNLTYLCECKHWNSSVPKTIVHSFRTVVSDHGAHLGFLVSKNGFQSGAYKAAESSNIKLVNWYEFQEMFIDRWKDGRYEMLRQLFEDLFEFYDFLSAPIGNAIGGNSERMAEYNMLINRFSPQADANPWNRMIETRNFPPKLPYQVSEVSANGCVTKLVFNDYASLFDWHERQAKIGLEEFGKFVSKYRTGPVVI